VKDPKVERQHGQNKDIKADPHPNEGIHCCIASCKGRGWSHKKTNTAHIKANVGLTKIRSAYCLQPRIASGLTIANPVDAGGYSPTERMDI